MQTIIDAHSHVIEPLDLWESYLEPAYRPRAIRIRRDEHGLEYVECAGRAVRGIRNGTLPVPGGMRGVGERTYAARDSTIEAQQRVRILDANGIAAAVVFPTLALLWEADVRDPELALAYCRAYNRWIVELCSSAPGRLVPIAHLSLLDVPAATVELERAVKDGCRGAFVAPFTHGRAHGHPDHDALFAKLEELAVPLVFHPVLVEPEAIAWRRFHGMEDALWYQHVVASHGVQTAFTMLFAWAVFDRFPKLQVVVLGAGAGWIGYWMDRMDALYAIPAYRPNLRHQPSHYIRNHCWIGADGGERTLAGLARFVGAERFLWGSHYPHTNYPASYAADLRETLARMPAATAARIAGANAAALFRIT